jgi:hypothetical protein
MRWKFAGVAAFVAVGSLAAPASAAGIIAGGGGAVPPPPPPPGLSIVSKLGNSSIAVNTGAPLVDVTLITNNSPDPAAVTLSYSVSTDQLSASCGMLPWSEPEVQVSPGSTVGVTTKVPTPGCSGAYSMTVSASAAGVDPVETTVDWFQFLKLRNGG